MQGIDAHAYSGETEPERRLELEDALIANEVKALVATSALGMGLDEPDLGFVIHRWLATMLVERLTYTVDAGGATDLPRSEFWMPCSTKGSVGRRGRSQKTYTRGDAIPIHRRGEAGATEIASADPVPSLVPAKA